MNQLLKDENRCCLPPHSKLSRKETSTKTSFDRFLFKRLRMEEITIEPPISTIVEIEDPRPETQVEQKVEDPDVFDGPTLTSETMPPKNSVQSDSNITVVSIHPNSKVTNLLFV